MPPVPHPHLMAADTGVRSVFMCLLEQPLESGQTVHTVFFTRPGGATASLPSVTLTRSPHVHVEVAGEPTTGIACISQTGSLTHDAVCPQSVRSLRINHFSVIKKKLQFLNYLKCIWTLETDGGVSLEGFHSRVFLKTLVWCRLDADYVRKNVWFPVEYGDRVGDSQVVQVRKIQQFRKCIYVHKRKNKVTLSRKWGMTSSGQEHREGFLE